MGGWGNRGSLNRGWGNRGSLNRGMGKQRQLKWEDGETEAA